MGLEVVELVMAAEEHFAIQVDDEEAAKLVNCGLFCDYIIAKLRARGDSRTGDEVWSQLKAIIVEQLGVKPDDVRREAKFYEDLGCG